MGRLRRRIPRVPKDPCMEAHCLVWSQEREAKEAAEAQKRAERKLAEEKAMVEAKKRREEDDEDWKAPVTPTLTLVVVTHPPPQLH